MFPEFYNRKNNQAFTKAVNRYISEGATAEIINDIPRFVDSGSYASVGWL